MKYDLIKTNDYLIIVNNEKIDDGGYSFVTNTIMSYAQMMKEWGQSLGRKIIAHLPLNDADILDGVDLLPEIKDDFDKIISDIDFKGDTNSFISGFNTAKETYKFTFEDLRAAFNKGHQVGVYLMDYKHDEMFENFVQSIKQPISAIAFECEMEKYSLRTDDNDFGYGYHIKKTVNSDGRIQWIGKYIF